MFAPIVFARGARGLTFGRACRWHAWHESSRQIKPAGENCLKATIRWASMGRHVWGLHVLEWCAKKLELWQIALVLLTLVRPKR